MLLEPWNKIWLLSIRLEPCLYSTILGRRMYKLIHCITQNEKRNVQLECPKCKSDWSPSSRTCRDHTFKNKNILIHLLYIHYKLTTSTCKLTTITRMVATANPKLCISAASLPSAFTLWYMVPYGMKKSTNELIIPCMTLKRNSFLLKRTRFV